MNIRKAFLMIQMTLITFTLVGCTQVPGAGVAQTATGTLGETPEVLAALPAGDVSPLPGDILSELTPQEKALNDQLVKDRFAPTAPTQPAPPERSQDFLLNVPSTQLSSARSTEVNKALEAPLLSIPSVGSKL